MHTYGRDLPDFMELYDNRSQVGTTRISCTSASATPSPNAKCASAPVAAPARWAIWGRGSALAPAAGAAASAPRRSWKKPAPNLGTVSPVDAPVRSSSNRPRPKEARDEGRQEGHPAPEQSPVQRAHGDQPVHPARPHVRELGPEEARGLREEGVDRRDEARRPADRAHPVSRGAAGPAGPGKADDRRERAGGAGMRPQP